MKPPITDQHKHEFPKHEPIRKYRPMKVILHELRNENSKSQSDKIVFLGICGLSAVVASWCIVEIIKWVMR